MSHVRLATLVASLACALLIGGVGTASANSTSQPFAKKIPISGATASGKKLHNATFTIQNFSKKDGKIYANGVVRGIFKGQAFKRNVSSRVTNPNVVAPASAAQLPPIAGACQILNLRLGPINLNLLGLVVRTNAINVRIDAVPGNGNLLGNLLCGITNALNPGSLTGIQNTLTQILNALLALAPRTV
jgi:hypothetical protein